VIAVGGGRFLMPGKLLAIALAWLASRVPTSATPAQVGRPGQFYSTRRAFERDVTWIAARLLGLPGDQWGPWCARRHRPPLKPAEFVMPWQVYEASVSSKQQSRWIGCKQAVQQARVFADQLMLEAGEGFPNPGSEALVRSQRSLCPQPPD